MTRTRRQQCRVRVVISANLTGVFVVIDITEDIVCPYATGGIGFRAKGQWTKSIHDRLLRERGARAALRSFQKSHARQHDRCSE